LSTARTRPAGQDDLPELFRIYDHYVTATHVTFDTQPFTAGQRRSWFAGFAESGPHRLLVAEVDARLVGYASSKPFRAKRAYHSSVETTIYLDPDARGRGTGRALYAALLDALLAEPSVHRAYAGIALPNEHSIALHEQLGFQRVGTFREVGFKFAKYWDVSWYEKDVSGRSAGGV